MSFLEQEEIPMASSSRWMIGWFWMAVVLLLMNGCRSSTKESAGEEEVGISYVGLDTCFNCHADDRLGKFPSMIGNKDDSNVGWLYSPHGNYEARDENFQPIDLGVDNDGFPNYAFFEDETCQNCHDPLEDGRTFSVLDSLYDVDEIGRVDRPVVGCESCHGPGGNHFGIGPLPYPNPDPSRCGQCHNDALPDDHLPFHPEADRIFEDYQTSHHAQSINEPTRVEGSETDVRARCSRCHTDEGVKLYKERVPGTTGYDDLRAFFEDKPDQKNPSAVQCRTCHDVHNQGKTLLADLTDDQSDQFATCTTCHQLNKEDGTVLT